MSASEQGASLGRNARGTHRTTSSGPDMVPRMRSWAIAKVSASRLSGIVGGGLSTYPHREMRHALLDDAGPDDSQRLARITTLPSPLFRLRASFLDVAFKEAAFREGGLLGNEFSDRERLCVDGRLRYQAVRSGQADQTGDERRTPEEEKVPVEACGSLHGEAARLRHDGADVVLCKRGPG